MNEFFKYSALQENHFTKNGEVVQYKKNQFIVWKSDNCPWVFFLKEGYVRVTFSFKDGSSRLIGYFVPGTIFAQSGCFFDDERGHIEYIAETNAKTIRIKKEDFLNTISKNNDLCLDYLNQTLRNQIFLIERIIYQGEKTIPKKFARWLIFMDKFYGTNNIKNQREIYIPITQENIANFLHVTRESINSTIQKFIQKKYIIIKNKKITILNKQAIINLIQE